MVLVSPNSSPHQSTSADIWHSLILALGILNTLFHTLGCTIFVIYRLKIRLKNVGGAPIFSTLFITKEMRRVQKCRQHSLRDERQGLSAQIWPVVKFGGQRLLPVFSQHPASHQS